MPPGSVARLQHGECGGQVGDLGGHVDEASAVGEHDGVPARGTGRGPRARRTASPSRSRSWCSQGSQTTSAAAMLSSAHSVVPLNLMSDPPMRLDDVDGHLGHDEDDVVEVAVRDPEPVARTPAARGGPRSSSSRRRRRASSSPIICPFCRVEPWRGPGSAATLIRPLAVRITKRRLTMRNRDVPTVVRLLEHARYEVLPTPTIEEKVLAGVPTDVQVTVTASPDQGAGADLRPRRAVRQAGVRRRTPPRGADGERPRGARGDRGPAAGLRRHDRLRARRRRRPGRRLPRLGDAAARPHRDGLAVRAGRASRATPSRTPRSTTT